MWIWCQWLILVWRIWTGMDLNKLHWYCGEDLQKALRDNNVLCIYIVHKSSTFKRFVQCLKVNIKSHLCTVSLWHSGSGKWPVKGICFFSTIYFSHACPGGHLIAYTTLRWGIWTPLLPWGMGNWPKCLKLWAGMLKFRIDWYFNFELCMKKLLLQGMVY